jgi:hypothetical protein
VIAWSWWWVLSPFAIDALFLLVIFGIFGLTALSVLWPFGKKKKRG